MLKLPPIEEYSLLYVLETESRRLIESELSKISGKWWGVRIAEDVRKNAEDRMIKTEQLWPWYHRNSTNPIHFIDFADYVKIITKNDNWKDVFSNDN